MYYISTPVTVRPNIHDLDGMLTYFSQIHVHNKRHQCLEVFFYFFDKVDKKKIEHAQTLAEKK